MGEDFKPSPFLYIQMTNDNEKRKYKCWKCMNKWFIEKELIVRNEDYNHRDYVCPNCEAVIICVEIKEQCK